MRNSGDTIPILAIWRTVAFGRILWAEDAAGEFLGIRRILPSVPISVLCPPITHRVVERLESRARRDRRLPAKFQAWRKEMSRVKS